VSIHTNSQYYDEEDWEFLHSFIITMQQQQLITIDELDLADTVSLNDAEVSSILQRFRFLRALRLSNCAGLRYPFITVLSDFSLKIDKLYIEGCWQLDLTHVQELKASNSICIADVDVLSPLSVGEPCQVVILQDLYRGNWVDCRITQIVSMSEDQYQQKYDIHVLRTLLFNSAVGFSDRPALSITRMHLRRKLL
jgi:hypothetical protein